MQFKTFAAAVLIGWSSFAVAETPQNAPGPEREYSGSSSQPAIPAAGKDMILETYVRVFVEASAIDRTIAFYRTLLSGEQTMRFDYPETGLVVAAVSSPRLSVLIIAGSPENRARFEATRLTVKVERLEPFLEVLKEAGAEQLEPIQPTPVGRKTRYRHPDGTIVEYVENIPPKKP